MTQIASEISKMIDMLPEERGRGFVIQRSVATKDLCFDLRFLVALGMTSLLQ